jgi:hypothetical protein
MVIFHSCLYVYQRVNHPFFMVDFQIFTVDYSGCSNAVTLRTEVSRRLGFCRFFGRCRNKPSANGIHMGYHSNMYVYIYIYTYFWGDSSNHSMGIWMDISAYRGCSPSEVSGQKMYCRGPLGFPRWFHFLWVSVWLFAIRLDKRMLGFPPKKKHCKIANHQLMKACCYFHKNEDDVTFFHCVCSMHCLVPGRILLFFLTKIISQC